MTPHEAETELKRLFMAYPSYRAWINRESENPAETLSIWCRKLGRSDRADVAEVIDGMIAGTIATRDQFDKPDVLIDRILERADARRKSRESMRRLAELQEQAEYDQPRFGCGVCRDGGTVEIWQPEYVRAVRAGSPERIRTGKTCVVACGCRAGLHHRNGRFNDKGEVVWPPLRSLDEAVMCRSDRDIVEWLNRPVEEHPNYHREFDEFK